MIFNYDAFYRRHGIRFKADVKNPPMTAFNTLRLPMLSSIHFVQYDPDEGFEVPESHFLLSEFTKRMFATVVEFYPFEDALGEFRLTFDKTKQEVLDYYRLNKKIANPHGEVIKDAYTVQLFTYGLINRRYLFYKTRKSNELLRWANHHRSVFYTMNEAAKKDGRHHFVVLDVPKAIPSLPKLRQREESTLDRPLLRYFRTQDEWMVLSLWQMFHKLDGYIFKDLEAEQLDKINIIWRAGSVCMIMNLGKVLGFNQAFDASSEMSEYQFSKYILNAFLLMSEGSTTVPTDALMESVQEVDELDGIDAEEQKKINEALDALLGPITAPAMLDVSTIRSDRVHHERVIKGISETGGKEVSLDEESSEEDVIDERLANLTYTDSEVHDEFELDSEDLAYVEYEPIPNGVLDAQTSVVAIATARARNGGMTAGELRHTTKLAEKYQSLKNPYNPKQSLVEALTVSAEDVALDTNVGVVSEAQKKLIPDESMYESSLKRFDEKYISTLMPKHITRSVMSLASIGISIQDYDIERVSNINDDFEIHSVKVATVNGKTSTVRFRIPAVNDYGEFRLGGIKYRMRKQWADLPIRKISDSEVALTSYYSKLFIQRTPRAAYNYERWITSTLIEMGIDDGNSTIQNLKLNNVFDNTADVPRVYSMIAKKISEFECSGYHFFFDVNKIKDNFPGERERETSTPIARGLQRNEEVIYMDNVNGMLTVNNQEISLLKLLGLSEGKKVPQDYAEIRMFGKPIPLVYILGYQMGLGNLLKTLKVDYQRLSVVPSNLHDTHLVIRFKDESILVPLTDEKACMLLGGFNRFHNDIRSYSVYSFDDKEVYSTVFENNRIDLRFLKECVTMFPMWVDHITRDILLEMNEPTDLVLLLLRAVEMLLTDKHPDAMDTTQMRIRGYERFSGMVYSELVREARAFNFKPNRKDKMYSINPEAVWYAIRNDNSISVVEECNPIHNLKEQEVIVFSGEGGRSNVTMTATARKFHKNAMGIVSEATVDSQHVGVITYLSANPSFNSLYGTITPVDPAKELPAARLVSTSTLLAPGADIDDPKRANFTTVQNSQTMGTLGYELLPVRTGYERVIGARVSDTFCRTAKMDGVITDRDDKTNTVMVTYSDNSTEKFSIATVYAPWSGKLIAQPTKCDFNKGDTFKAHDVLSYNPLFFKKDKLTRNQVSLTTQTLARVAIIEGGDVYEDSCALSLALSEKLGSELAHVRSIVLDEGQDIVDLVEVGDEVQPDSILCTIINSQTDSSFYDEQTLSLLEKIGSTSPRAKSRAIITKIEVLYTGEVEDMPQNVQDVAIASDKALYRAARKLDTDITNGRVDIGHRIEGNGLGLNQVVIKVYMVSPLTMATGDKLVVSSQLKGTVARVWSDNNRDESGVPIDAYFSGYSMDKRVVDSPFLIGSTSTLLKEVTKRAVDHYFN